ncbi:MAG TPA: helix-turn-helix transcriptional regulator [Candidatus Tidjanibacter gallistercoris]|nr:helix-turn-helix transcriptional regulator [Candidatus Tidjanibacter gallistercoris]
MKNNIKVQRAVHDMTQQELADRVGVSRQTINAVELGKYVPSTVLAMKVAAVFSKSVNEIFTLEETD